MPSTISSDPGLEPIPGDAGISLPSTTPTFVVARGGKRHRELCDRRDFEARFAVPGPPRRKNRVDVDWDAVWAYRKSCIGGEKLLELAERAPAKHKAYALHVPLELRRKVKLANCVKPGIRRPHALALGWVITATHVMDARGLYASHEDMGKLLGLEKKQAGTIMRELADLGLVRLQPLYRPRGAEEKHPELAKKRLSAVRMANAYELTEHARRVFGIAPKPARARGWGKRQMARAIVAGEQSGVENCQGTGETYFLRKSVSDARARENEEGFAARAGGAGGFAGRSATSPLELELAGEPIANASSASSAPPATSPLVSRSPEAPEGRVRREAARRRAAALAELERESAIVTVARLQHELDRVTAERDAFRDESRVTSRDVTSRDVTSSTENALRDVTKTGGAA